MEKTQKQRKKSTSFSSADIITAYKQYLLLQGHRPPSVYKFCVDQGITEDEFYNHFGSFDGLEKKLWKDFIDDTTTRLKNDAAFKEFSSREKVLAFYYTLLELFKSNRSYILLSLDNRNKLDIVPEFLKDFKTGFESFVGELLSDGKTSGEIADRPFVEKRYPQLFWAHFSFLLLFWKDDNSAGFEKTDAYVEKSVNLAFDLISKGAVDSAIDFAKFLYQNK